MSEQLPPVDSNPGDKYPAPYNGPPPTQDDKTMGLLCHVLGIPVFIIGPLIVWLVKKDQSPFVDDQGKESLNFQITTLIASLCCVPLFFVCIGYPILILVHIAHVVFTILATMQAYNGIAYRYPVNIRLLK